MNNFFCPLPWNHLFFKPNGKVQACCETWENQFDPSETIAETANNPILRQLRLDLIDPNTTPEMCHLCVKKESSSLSSTRTDNFEIFPHINPESAKEITYPDGTIDNFRLEYLDVRSSNLCNYKCRFCSLGSSNLWLKDHKLLGYKLGRGKYKDYDPKTGISEYNINWEDLKTHLPYLRKVKLAGGEPTIMPGTYQMLEELINIGNLDLQLILVTNASKVEYGKYNILSLLENFKHVDIGISAESMGTKHDWQRAGKTDWDNVAENIEKYKSFCQTAPNNVRREAYFHVGISWVNLWHLPSFIQAYPDMQFTFNLVTFPTELNINAFTRSELERCVQHYERILDCPLPPRVTKHLQQVKQTIEDCARNTSDDFDIAYFKSIHNILDASRNQSFIDTFPEWRHLYEQ